MKEILKRKMNEQKYLVLTASFIPFGPARLDLLKNYFGSYKKVWNTSRQELLRIGLNKNLVEKFIEHKSNFDEEEYFKELEKRSIKFITKNDPDYPENLSDLDDAPSVLYIKGSLLKQDQNAVAIVGSRKMTTYGREVTEKLATELASFGVTIISGLAFGIDVTAHKSALLAGGRCIAVLASGCDEITPKSNEWLGRDILRSKGAIISEFPLGTIPQKSYFPHRNRIISGLSKAIIVIEGMQKSGTIHTAYHAAKQGREVFAVPGQITSPMSQAPHYLLKNGAKLVTGVKDILEELDLQVKVDLDQISQVLPSNDAEKILIEKLTREERHLDELARITGLSVDMVSATLTIMELKGMVKSLGAGIYKKI